MVISEDLLKSWEPLQSAGDAEKIAAMMQPQIHIESVRRALRDRKCSDKLFKCLVDYYRAKAEMVAEAVSDPIIRQVNEMLNGAEQVD